MADDVVVDTKVSNEGRVVIPAVVRSVLGVTAGDRVRFIVHDGEVKVVGAQSLLHAVWANNTGGDAGSGVADTRAARGRDQDLSAAKWGRVEQEWAHADRSEDELAADLLGRLGLA